MPRNPGDDRPQAGGTYDGPVKAFVRDNLDPDKTHRVRLYCPAVMGEEDVEAKWIGWAEPLVPFSKSATDTGSCVVPDVGAGVWVMFQGGDPSFPLYFGGTVQGDSADTSSVPKAARGLDDGTLGTDRTVGGVSIPKSAGGTSVYPRNRVVKTSGGHVIELDDTTGKRRVRIRHGSGSFTEYTEAGSLVKQVVADFLVWAGASMKVGAVQSIVLASASILVGSASAGEGVVKQSSLTAAFNAHTHDVSIVSIPGPHGQFQAGATPVTGTVTATTEGPSPTLTTGDFSNKFKFDQ